MAGHAGQIQATTMVGVGAAFDFHSGKVKWAPTWMRRIGLEWVHRLMLNPRRMWLVTSTVPCSWRLLWQGMRMAFHRTAHRLEYGMVASAERAPTGAANSRPDSEADEYLPVVSRRVARAGGRFLSGGWESGRRMINKRVLIAIPCFCVGGTEVHTLALSRALIAGGYEVTVCVYFEFEPGMVEAVRGTGDK